MNRAARTPISSPCDDSLSLLALSPSLHPAQFLLTAKAFPPQLPVRTAPPLPTTHTNTHRDWIHREGAAVAGTPFPPLRADHPKTSHSSSEPNTSSQWQIMPWPPGLPRGGGDGRAQRRSRGPQRAHTLCSFHLHLCWLSGMTRTHCCEKPRTTGLHLGASSPIMEVMLPPLLCCLPLFVFFSSHLASLSSSFSFAYFSSLVSHLHFCLWVPCLSTGWLCHVP